MENEGKKIDSDWKEQVEKEKHQYSEHQNDQSSAANFNFFITSLAMQAMIAMGEIENPVTNRKEKDLNQAKYLIDILGILKEKTENNLNEEENNLLDNLLYQLRTTFIKISNKK
ncbi:MAG: DUF1844 domain-containing protein [Candidatus Omnitrophica bacterium]|nr:DUF1844 domain-containing protein [Candidatus Omnitrophota bacterium]